MPRADSGSEVAEAETYGVAGTARILGTDTNKIKTWAYEFKEFMSQDATPTKGSARRYTREDIRVFAYVLQYWEDEPDDENIRYSLISNDHHDHELIDQLLLQITPLFIEPPEDMDESWHHGVLHGGMSEVWDRFWLAESYMLAGHRLVDIALENEDVQRLFYPAIYNYRHAMELYLKAVPEVQEQTHDLAWLFTEFEVMIKAKFTQSSPTWLTNLIATFIDYDPGGISFRYGGSTGKDEVFIDFRHLKRLMGWAGEGFRNVRSALGLPDAGF